MGGLAPYFWDKLCPDYTPGILLALGLALVAGAATVKAVKG